MKDNLPNRGFVNDLTEAFDEDLMKAMHKAHIPGAALVRMRDGQIHCVRNYGLADPESGRAVNNDTMFTIASISKIVTTTVLMMLHEQGKFALDDDINNFLPFKTSNPFYPQAAISFRMLLSHTSTICDNDKYWDYYTLKQTPVLPDSPLSLDDFLKDYLSGDDVFLNAKPGTIYRYSNAGFGLVGYLVENIAHMPFDVYCKQALFNPLGIHSAGWHFKAVNQDLMAIPYGYDEVMQRLIRHGFYGYPTYPDGALKISALEFARFFAVYINDGKSLDGKQIVRSQTVKEILKTHAFPGLEDGETVGLGWHYNGRVYHHDGGDPGISTLAFFQPASRRGFLFFCNGSDLMCLRLLGFPLSSFCDGTHQLFE